MAHPWFATFASASVDELEPLDAGVLKSMRDFSKSNALKRAVLRAIAPVATAEHVAEWAGHFEALDQDGDGKVSIKDLARRLVEHGGLTAAEASGAASGDSHRRSSSGVGRREGEVLPKVCPESAAHEALRDGGEPAPPALSAMTQPSVVRVRLVASGLLRHAAPPR